MNKKCASFCLKRLLNYKSVHSSIKAVMGSCKLFDCKHAKIINSSLKNIVTYICKFQILITYEDVTVGCKSVAEVSAVVVVKILVLLLHFPILQLRSNCEKLYFKIMLLLVYDISNPKQRQRLKKLFESKQHQNIGQ